MVKRGKCPSLISGRQPNIEVVKTRRKCKRCNIYILKGESCASIPTPSRMGSKTYCLSCLKEIIKKTTKDLESIISSI